MICMRKTRRSEAAARLYIRGQNGALSTSFRFSEKPRHIVAFYNFLLNSVTDTVDAKGQLISKCPYEKSVLSKIPTKKFPRFLP